jgi:hypothetical protein
VSQGKSAKPLVHIVVAKYRRAQARRLAQPLKLKDGKEVLELLIDGRILEIQKSNGKSNH